MGDEEIPIPDNRILNLLWLSMLASPAILYVSLLMMDFMKLIDPVPFEFAVFIFYAGLALVPIAVLALRFYKNANRLFLETLKRDPERADRARRVFLQRLVPAMAVADAPATIAIAYYFLSGDIDHAALLVLTSLILCYFFKPELPARSRPAAD